MTDQNDAGQDAPKIIVDDDWKAQAQAEKAKLAEQEAEAAAEAGPEGQRQIPPASFEMLVSTMVTQTMFPLGAIPDPQTGQRYMDLDVAKHHVDMLGILVEKTKGNLDEDEAKLIDQALYECRMHYVQVGNAVANQVMGDGAPGGAPAEGEPLA